jgi:MscS family membrane protein
MNQIVNMAYPWLEKWLSFFQDNLPSLLGALLIVLLFLGLRKYLVQYIFKWIKRWTSNKESYYPRIIDAVESPLRLFILVVGIFLALRLLPLSIAADAAIVKIFRSVVIFLPSFTSPKY